MGGFWRLVEAVPGVLGVPSPRIAVRFGNPSLRLLISPRMNLGRRRILFKVRVMLRTIFLLCIILKEIKIFVSNKENPKVDKIFLGKNIM